MSHNHRIILFKYTPPKFNMEFENDGFQVRNLLFQRAEFSRWTMSIQATRPPTCCEQGTGCSSSCQPDWWRCSSGKKRGWSIPVVGWWLIKDSLKWLLEEHHIFFAAVFVKKKSGDCCWRLLFSHSIFVIPFLLSTASWEDLEHPLVQKVTITVCDRFLACGFCEPFLGGRT